jgi:hypothetical protein
MNSANAIIQFLRTQTLCGAQNPTRINATSTSSSTAAASTSTSTGGFTSFGGSGSGGSSGSGSGSGSSSSGKSSAVSLIQLGNAYGLGALALGIFSGFALLL